MTNHIKLLLRAMFQGTIGVLVACGVVWLFGIIPPDPKHTQSVIFGWLIGEAIIALFFGIVWLIQSVRARRTRYAKAIVTIQEYRRWHGEDGA